MEAHRSAGSVDAPRRQRRLLQSSRPAALRWQLELVSRPYSQDEVSLARLWQRIGRRSDGDGDGNDTTARGAIASTRREDADATTSTERAQADTIDLAETHALVRALQDFESRLRQLQGSSFSQVSARLLYRLEEAGDRGAGHCADPGSEHGNAAHRRTQVAETCADVPPSYAGPAGPGRSAAV